MRPRPTTRFTSPSVPAACMGLAFGTICFVLLTAPAGCGSSRAARDEAMMASARPPERFAVSLTVLGPAAAPASPTAEPAPRSLRPARYTLETDWVLRSTTTPWLITPQHTPPRTRQLDSREAAAVWATLRDSGLMDEARPDRVGRVPTVEDPFDPTGPFGGGVVYVLEYRAGARHGTLVTKAADADAEPLKSLAEQLATLAWVE